jgi:hypothetical protein
VDVLVSSFPILRRAAEEEEARKLRSEQEEEQKRKDEQQRAAAVPLATEGKGKGKRAGGAGTGGAGGAPKGKRARGGALREVCVALHSPAEAGRACEIVLAFVAGPGGVQEGDVVGLTVPAGSLSFSAGDAVVGVAHAGGSLGSDPSPAALGPRASLPVKPAAGAAGKKKAGEAAAAAATAAAAAAAAKANSPGPAAAAVVAPQDAAAAEVHWFEWRGPGVPEGGAGVLRVSGIRNPESPGAVGPLSLAVADLATGDVVDGPSSSPLSVLRVMPAVEETKGEYETLKEAAEAERLRRVGEARALEEALAEKKRAIREREAEAQREAVRTYTALHAHTGVPLARKEPIVDPEEASKLNLVDLKGVVAKVEDTAYWRGNRRPAGVGGVPADRSIAIAAPAPAKEPELVKRDEVPWKTREAERKALARMMDRTEFIKNPRNRSVPGAAFPFRCEPAEVFFKDFEVGSVYQCSVAFRNVTGVSHRLKVLPAPSRWFAVSSLRFPGDGTGIVGPGCAVQCTVTFSPDRLDDVEDSLQLISDDGSSPSTLRIAAARTPPVLEVGPVWDCGEGLLGAITIARFRVRNRGGRGRFRIFPAADEQQMQPGESPGSVLSSFTSGPFAIFPATFALEAGDELTLQVDFRPEAEGRSVVGFRISCDNLRSAECEVVGHGVSPRVAISSIGSRALGDGEDQPRAMDFGDLVVHSGAYKSFAARNLTGVPLPFRWERRYNLGHAAGRVTDPFADPLFPAHETRQVTLVLEGVPADYESSEGAAHLAEVVAGLVDVSAPRVRVDSVALDPDLRGGETLVHVTLSVSLDRDTGVSAEEAVARLVSLPDKDPATAAMLALSEVRPLPYLPLPEDPFDIFPAEGVFGAYQEIGFDVTFRPHTVLGEHSVTAALLLHDRPSGLHLSLEGASKPLTLECSTPACIVPAPVLAGVPHTVSLTLTNPAGIGPGASGAEVSFAWRDAFSEAGGGTMLSRTGSSVAAHPAAGSIEPGGSVTVEVILALMAPGQLEGTLRCEVRDGLPVEVLVRATCVAPAVRVLEPLVDFGIVRSGHAPTAGSGTVTVVNPTRARVPWCIAEAHDPPGPFPESPRSARRGLATSSARGPSSSLSFTPASGVLAPGASQVVSVSLIPRSLDRFVEELTLPIAVHSKDAPEPSLSLAVARVEVPRAHVPHIPQPPLLSVGVPWSTELTIMNLCNLPLRGTVEIALASEGVDVQISRQQRSVQIAAAADLVLPVVLTATKPGPFECVFAVELEGLELMGAQIIGKARGLGVSYEVTGGPAIKKRKSADGGGDGEKEDNGDHGEEEGNHNGDEQITVRVARRLAAMEPPKPPSRALPCVYFGDDVPLGEVRTVTVLIKNDSEVPSTFGCRALRLAAASPSDGGGGGDDAAGVDGHSMLSAQSSRISVRPMSGVEPPSSSAAASTRNGGVVSQMETTNNEAGLTLTRPGTEAAGSATLASPNYLARLKAERADKARKAALLSRNLGAALVVSPPSGQLGPLETVAVTVTLHSDMWGLFEDHLEVTVGGKVDALLEVRAGVVGNPVTLQQRAAGLVLRDGSGGIAATLSWGPMACGEPRAAKDLLLSNSSPFDLRLLWTVENYPESAVTVEFSDQGVASVRATPSILGDGDFSLENQEVLLPARGSVKVSPAFTPSSDPNRGRCAGMLMCRVDPVGRPAAGVEYTCQMAIAVEAGVVMPQLALADAQEEPVLWTISASNVAATARAVVKLVNPTSCTLGCTFSVASGPFKIDTVVSSRPPAPRAAVLRTLTAAAQAAKAGVRTLSPGEALQATVVFVQPEDPSFWRADLATFSLPGELQVNYTNGSVQRFSLRADVVRPVVVMSGPRVLDAGVAFVGTSRKVTLTLVNPTNADCEWSLVPLLDGDEETQSVKTNNTSHTSSSSIKTGKSGGSSIFKAPTVAKTNPVFKFEPSSGVLKAHQGFTPNSQQVMVTCTPIHAVRYTRSFVCKVVQGCSASADDQIATISVTGSLNERDEGLRG